MEGETAFRPTPEPVRVVTVMPLPGSAIHTPRLAAGLAEVAANRTSSNPVMSRLVRATVAKPSEPPGREPISPETVRLAVAPAEDASVMGPSAWARLGVTPEGSFAGAPIVTPPKSMSALSVHEIFPVVVPAPPRVPVTSMRPNALAWPSSEPRLPLTGPETLGPSTGVARAAVW